MERRARANGIRLRDEGDLDALNEVIRARFGFTLDTLPAMEEVFITLDHGSGLDMVPEVIARAYPSARYTYRDADGAVADATVMWLPANMANRINIHCHDAPETVQLTYLVEYDIPAMRALPPVEMCRRVAFLRRMHGWEDRVAARAIVGLTESISVAASNHGVSFEEAVELAPAPDEHDEEPFYDEDFLDAALTIAGRF